MSSFSRVAGTAGAAIVVPIIGDASKLSKGLTTAQRQIQAFGAAATAALVAFGVSSVRAYNETEQAQFKLNFALSKSPALWNTNVTALRAYNSALASKTAIDDDVIAGAESILARYSASETQLKSLTQTTLDYAAVTGKSVDESATTIGKALLGNTRALKALGIDYKTTGDAAVDSANIQKLVMEKVGGAAEAWAKTSAGRIADMKRQWGELQETIGAALLPMLASLAKTFGTVLGAINKLPRPVAQATYAIALMGAGAMMMAPRILAAIKVIKELGETSAVVKGINSVKSALAGLAGAEGAAGLGGLSGIGSAMAALLPAVAGVTAALTPLAAGIYFFIKGSHEAAAMTQDYAKTLDVVTGSATRATQALMEHNLAQSEALKNLPTDKLQALSKELIDGKTPAQAWADVMGQGARMSAQAGVAMMHEQEAVNGATKAAQSNTDATSQQAAATQQLTDKVNKLRDSITILKQGFLDQQDATMGWQKSIDDANAALKQNGKTLNMNTEAGRANRQALEGMAQAMETKIKSDQHSGYTAEQTMADYKKMRAELVQQAMAFGMTRDAAKKYVDQVSLTPKQLTTQLKPEFQLEKVQQYLHALGLVPKTIITTGIFKGKVVPTGGMATGGYISGPGTGTSDSIPAYLSNGEYVVRAAAVAKYGVGLLDRINAKRFASGGQVTKSDLITRSQDRLANMTDPIIKRMQHAIDLANSNLSAIRQGMHNLSSSVVGMVQNAGGLSNITAPDGMHLDKVSLAAGVHARLASVRSFVDKLRQLAKLGLSRFVMQQIIGMGPDQGLDYANALLQGGKAVVRDISMTEAKINSLGRSTGRMLGQHYYGDALDHARDVRNRHHDRLRREQRAVQEVHNHIKVDVHGSVLSQQELTKLLRDELKKLDKINGRR